MENQNLPTVVNAQYSVVDIAPVSVTVMQKQINAIQEVMAQNMKKGTHYGAIPGTAKNEDGSEKYVLLKAGAEKLGMMFRLIPSFEITRADLENGHREYEIRCTLRDPAGNLIGQGVGLCSTMETKYRYRNDGELTDIPVPQSYWKDRSVDTLKALVPEHLKGHALMTKKVDGKWFVATKKRVENPDLADTYNTVLKMAKKRAHVDAVITCTAASDIFTQDVDESLEPDEPKSGAPAGTANSAPQQNAQPVQPKGTSPDGSGVLDHVDTWSGQPPNKLNEPDWKNFKWRLHLPIKKKGEKVNKETGEVLPIDDVMPQVREMIKKMGFRFNGDDKHWYGNSDKLPSKLQEYHRAYGSNPEAEAAPKVIDAEIVPQTQTDLTGNPADVFGDDDIPF